jgi:hypothetical protein
MDNELERLNAEVSKLKGLLFVYQDLYHTSQKKIEELELRLTYGEKTYASGYRPLKSASAACVLKSRGKFEHEPKLTKWVSEFNSDL